MAHNHSAIKRRISMTWIQTALGVLFLAALSVGGLWYLGFHWSFGMIILGLWVLFPLLGWYHSGTLVKKLMRCQAPNLNDPDHARLVRLVDKLYPVTGLPVKPPVYVSPLPVPNAFATGRNPRNAFIAATEGLFEVGLNDDELEAILAHELAHVKAHDVAITSFTAVLGSAFSLIVAQGLPWLFHGVFSSRKSATLLDKLENKVNKQKKGFFATTGGIAGFIVMAILFYIVSIFAKFVTLFVSRCRESHADALAALWTNNPCALSTSLQKIVLWMTFHSGPDMKTRFLISGLSPLLLVSDFDNEFTGDPKKNKGGVFASIRRWWKGLGENHPPIPERLKMLDEMSGGSCPRIM
ncbi:M48 family metalloprotease [Candidatus Obscuribacterales bacterium]|nr:M48 family metalloprotease [Candidatus Obscuribacterales bacterium]